jgi:hypothetical protein
MDRIDLTDKTFTFWTEIGTDHGCMSPGYASLREITSVIARLGFSTFSN